MIVDFLHDFYTMPINIVIGGVATQTTIRWYKAPAGAKFLPVPSAIFSHIWDNNPGESVPGAIGEVGAPRVWDPGRNPGYQGQCYRGQASWFQTGQLPPLGSIPPSACPCQIPPAIAEGGLVLGGSASSTGCQQWGFGTVFIDRLDGAGPRPTVGPFNAGAYNFYSVSNPSFVPQTGVAQALPIPRNTCTVVGKAQLNPSPPFNVQFFPFGVLRSLTDFRLGNWDSFGDGTVFANVYTRSP